MDGGGIIAVADLPAPLQRALGGRDVIVFDGVCVLCTGFFRFVLRHDRRGRFAFAVAQSPLGADFYRAMGLPADDYETNLVVVGGRIYTKLDAFAAVMGAFDPPMSMLAALRHLPRAVKDPLYTSIATNRYRLFGRRTGCLWPHADLENRFLAGGTPW